MNPESVLRELASAIIQYRLRGSRDFSAVNEALLKADDILFPVKSSPLSRPPIAL